MSHGPWPLVLASCLAWSSCATAPSLTGPEPTRAGATAGATEGAPAEAAAPQPGTDTGGAPAVEEPPALGRAARRASEARAATARRLPRARFAIVADAFMTKFWLSCGFC